MAHLLSQSANCCHFGCLILAGLSKFNTLKKINIQSELDFKNRQDKNQLDFKNQITNDQLGNLALKTFKIRTS